MTGREIGRRARRRGVRERGGGGGGGGGGERHRDRQKDIQTEMQVGEEDRFNQIN